MQTCSYTKLSFLIIASFLMCSCVVGQHLTIDSTPIAPTIKTNQGQVLVSVVDRREKVLSGKKRAHYIGRYRAGFGNPWDVSTQGKVPLATLVKKDLEEELTSLGYSQSESGNQLEVLILDWDFTGYQNGRFWYDLEISVKDSGGEVTASDNLGEEIQIKGTFINGAKGGFERDMPSIYDKIIRLIAR